MAQSPRMSDTEAREVWKQMLHMAQLQPQWPTFSITPGGAVTMSYPSARVVGHRP